MTRPGVKPTDGPKRFRGQALTNWVDVEDKPYDGPSPDLPSDVLWPVQTRAWYEVVRHLPHAVLWDDGEWQEILTTALLHASVWREPDKPSAAVLSELRQREKALGLTAEARVDLRIRYVEPRKTEPEPEESAPAKVVALNPNLRPRPNALDS